MLNKDTIHIAVTHHLPSAKLTAIRQTDKSEVLAYSYGKDWLNFHIANGAVAIGLAGQLVAQNLTDNVALVEAVRGLV